MHLSNNNKKTAYKNRNVRPRKNWQETTWRHSMHGYDVEGGNQPGVRTERDGGTASPDVQTCTGRTK